MNTIVLWDDREKGKVPSYLEKKLPKGVLERKRLPMGDYIIKIMKEFKFIWSNTPLAQFLIRGSEEIGINVISTELCIEHKAKDLINSIIERHLQNQLYKQSTKYYHSFLIFEGDLRELLAYSKFNYFALVQSLVNCALKRSPDGQQGAISIIQSNGAKQTADYITAIFNTVRKGDYARLPEIPRIKKIKDNPDKRIIMLLSMFPDISEKRAELLLNHFKTPMAIFNANKKDILEIKGIGEKTITKMKDLLNHEFKRNNNTKN